MGRDRPKLFGPKFLTKFETEVFWILTKLAEVFCADVSTFTVTQEFLSKPFESVSDLLIRFSMTINVGKIDYQVIFDELFLQFLVQLKVSSHV